MKKSRFATVMVLTGLFMFSSNFIHPVTPTLFLQLQFPEYLFGVAAAVLSIANFLFSPLWGVLCDRIGCIRVLAIGILGYGAGQAVFSVSTSVALTIAARFFTGAFAGAALIAPLMIVATCTEEGKRDRYLAYFAAYNAVSGSLGYFVGGFLGARSIPLAFFWQILLSAAIGIACLLLPDDAKPVSRERFSLSACRPTVTFSGFRKICSPSLIVFFLSVACVFFSSSCFDGSFNYYLREQLGFPATYNGTIKAAVGLVGLLSNFTINVYIASKTDIRKSMVAVLSAGSILLALLPLLQRVELFLSAGIAISAISTISLPIQQSLLARSAGTSGAAFGAFNAVQAAGSILGSLFAGFIYTVGPELPFVSAAAALCAAAVLCILNRRQHQTIHTEGEQP